MRVLELSEQAGGLPLVVVRFNPKKKLLKQLKLLLETCFIKPIDNMIDVVFLGYEKEYDVVEIVMKMI